MFFLKLVHLLFVVRLRRLFVDGHLIDEILAAFSDLHTTKAKRKPYLNGEPKNCFHALFKKCPLHAII